jgi:hypothetical protein
MTVTRISGLFPLRNRRISHNHAVYVPIRRSMGRCPRGVNSSTYRISD